MTTRPVLLLGSSGMLGRAFKPLLENLTPVLSCPSSRELDLTDARAVDHAVVSGALVINCAAWTDVDAAEMAEAAALRLNGDAVAHLARACARMSATLVHFSTDYVFDGRAQVPYSVEAPCMPINAYGRTKCAGERVLRASGADWLLVRTSWLYASWGKNFLTTIASKAQQEPRLRVVSDQHGRPTWVRHLADTTLALVARSARGVFHVTDGGPACSWYDFAREIVSCTRAHCRVTPCATSEYPRPAARPAYSVLDTSRAETLLGAWEDWRAHVGRACEELPSQGSASPPPRPVE